MSVVRYADGVAALAAPLAVVRAAIVGASGRRLLVLFAVRFFGVDGLRAALDFARRAVGFARCLAFGFAIFGATPPTK